MKNSPAWVFVWVFLDYQETAKTGFYPKSSGNITKEPKNLMFHGSKVGAADQIRTGDLILTKDALYRLSYSSVGDPERARTVDLQRDRLAF